MPKNPKPPNKRKVDKSSIQRIENKIVFKANLVLRLRHVNIGLTWSQQVMPEEESGLAGLCPESGWPVHCLVGS